MRLEFLFLLQMCLKQTRSIPESLGASLQLPWIILVHWVGHRVPQITSRMVGKFWARSPISFNHRSLWCPFVDLHHSNICVSDYVTKRGPFNVVILLIDITDTDNVPADCCTKGDNNLRTFHAGQKTSIGFTTCMRSVLYLGSRNHILWGNVLLHQASTF